MGRDFEVEGEAMVTAAINGDLFERLNQPAGAVQVRDELFCGAATAVGEFDEQGAPHLARGYLTCEVGAAERQRRCDREAGADRAADLVRHPGDQAAKRR